ncbi:MAG TPA: phosphotransferase [Puia sp.]|uniref:phosphotransferase n=1 Tax=Puia sp. TaxID=2045100 RepID=UPI002B8A6D77|nr:phosphotransferase [Puia sp.]HVU94138.1 phosphotransferase [Puia sp.]
MNPFPIHSLCRPGGIPGEEGVPELVETHISWVLVGERSVFKIKKPLQYSFLDFSTLEKRRHYCEREVELNRRLTEGIYLGVVPVWGVDGEWSLEESRGGIVEYAVWMHKMEPSRRMDLLARWDRLRESEIDALAELLGRFHRGAELAAEGDVRGDAAVMRDLFNDLGQEKEVLGAGLGSWAAEVIDRAMSLSDRFLRANGALLAGRRKAGLYRDGHGDLHCRNIFLLERPQVFDCIEFNDGLRQVDVLNDIAFLCMDLDSLGCAGLAERFVSGYCREFPGVMGGDERRLLNYYKAYRANIRAKINSLRARSAVSQEEKRVSLEAAAGYLRLMDEYWRLTGVSGRDDGSQRLSVGRRVV